MTSFLETARGRIAYHKTEGAGPGVIFLGGFKSDMEGSKAMYLEGWAQSEGRAFLRFDYTGHGSSSGDFVDGCIGDWARDAASVMDQLTQGPQVLVGSSMGGWIALLVCRALPERVHGLVGVAAAPDFTEDSMWEGFNAGQRTALLETGHVELPSDYAGGSYIITQKLIEDGRDQLVLRSPLPLPFPVRLLQGTDDAGVDLSVALRLLEHADAGDISLTIKKGVDHRFSTPECLEVIRQAIDEVSVN